MPGGLGREQQRQAPLDRGLHRLAEVHHRARLAVAVITSGGTETSLPKVPRREGDDAQLEFRDRLAVRSAVGAADDEQSSPPVALVLRHTGPYRYAELAGQLLRELSRGVDAFLRPRVQRVHVQALDQLARGSRWQDRGAQVALKPAAERDEQPDRVQRQHRGQLPALPAHGGHHEQRDRPLHPVDRVELLAGDRQPCRGGDPPAPQLDRVELVGVREHPP